MEQILINKYLRVLTLEKNGNTVRMVNSLIKLEGECLENHLQIDREFHSSATKPGSCVAHELGKLPMNWAKHPRELVSAPVVAGATLNRHQTRRFVRALNDGCKPYPVVPPPTPHRLTSNSWLSPATSQISQELFIIIQISLLTIDGDKGESYQKTTTRLVESISSTVLRTTIPYISNHFPTDEGWPVLSEPFGANTTSLRERLASKRHPGYHLVTWPCCTVRTFTDCDLLPASACARWFQLPPSLGRGVRSETRLSHQQNQSLIRMNRNILPLIKEMLINEY